jgi:hypothetical protein
MMAFAYIAESGLNYRRYLQGKISPTEFWTQTSLLSLTTIEGLAGGAGGVALGFALGTILLPGIGSLLGSIVGGLAGGLAGDKIMLNTYQTLENKIDYLLRLNAAHPLIHESLSDEDYKTSLRLLESFEEDELLTVENRFLEKLHYISEELDKARKAKDEFLINMRRAEVHSLY